MGNYMKNISTGTEYQLMKRQRIRVNVQKTAPSEANSVEGWGQRAM